jgi:hypothetical protein
LGTAHDVAAGQDVRDGRDLDGRGDFVTLSGNGLEDRFRQFQFSKLHSKHNFLW